MFKIACLASSAIVICVVLGTPPVAGGQADCAAVGTDGCCEVNCPCCNHVCKLSCKPDKEKNYCWNVICEPICIPKIRFPWEKSCKPKCAKVKYVKVLKKHEYECEVCKYKWTPVCANGCGNGNCGDPGCCDVGCDVMADPVEEAKDPKQANRVPQLLFDAAVKRSPKTNGPPTVKPTARRTLSDK